MLCDLLAIAIATPMAAMATALAMRLAIAIATTIAANYYSMVTLNWGGRSRGSRRSRTWSSCR